MTEIQSNVSLLVTFCNLLATFQLIVMVVRNISAISKRNESFVGIKGADWFGVIWFLSVIITTMRMQ